MVAEVAVRYEETIEFRRHMLTETEFKARRRLGLALQQPQPKRAVNDMRGTDERE